MNNEQKLIDIMFEIAMILTDKKYSKHFENKTNEQIAEYVRKQLNACGFKTIPVGSRWGVLQK